MNQIFCKKNVVLILIYFSLLLGIKVYQLPTIKNIFELVITILSIPAVIIFDRKALIYCTLVFTACIMQIDHHWMYVALCFYTISAFIKRQWLIPLTIIYHLNTIIIFSIDEHFHNINIIIYYSLCVIIFLMIYNYPKTQKKDLILNDDERYIVSELAKGKQIKEIDRFSKNTITAKLNSACKKNNIMNKNELIVLYKLNCE